MPEYSFRISGEEGSETIFDPIRKKYVRLTPEEWVRQNLLMFLTREKGVPRSLISIESGVKVNRLSRRYDAMVYDRNGKPFMLIECKAPTVIINQGTFDQIIAYNRKVEAKCLLVSNGLKHYCCKIEPALQKYIFMEDIPHYESI